MTVTINGTTGYTGPIGAIGDLSTTGNTTLGDAAGDTLTINGSTTTFTQGTANGVAYLNGSKVLTTGSALVFDGTNLGIGVTPSAWSGISAIQFNNGSLSWSTNRNYINSNAFWNGSNWVRTTTGAANQFITSWFDNSFTWNYAGSGSSGATVSWTSGMTLDASGNLGIATTSPTQKITVAGSIRATSNSSNFNETGAQFDYYSGAMRFAAYVSTGSSIQFLTNANGGNTAERARITSTNLDTFGLEQRFQTNSGGSGVSWAAVTGGAFGTAASRIYDAGNLRIWTDDYTYFDSTATAGGAGWYFTTGTSSSGASGTTQFTLSGDGNMYFADSGNTGKRGIQGICAANDYWFVGGGGLGSSNNGYMEIATGDDGQTAGGAEPIYVSQYGLGSPLTGTLQRRATLLDANGNTTFPGLITGTGGVTATGYLTANSRNYASSGFQLSGTFYLAGSGATYDTPTTGYRFSESYGIAFTSSGSVWHHQLINSSYIAGFGATGGNYGSGNCYLTGTLSQNYSDIRLKNDLGTIENALDKVMTLRGFRYTINALGKELGFNDDGVEAGLSAQDVQAVLPEAVMLAGSDIAPGPDGENISKSGEYYLTLRYDRVVPLLVNAIKELKAEFDAYKLTHP